MGESDGPVGPDIGSEIDAVVVGAGFAGLYAAHALRGRGLRVRGFEAGAGPGGTWYWNHYPGARCDIESLDYSYSFSEQLQRDWVWSERYPAQPEILRYLEHVADRFELRELFAFGTRVEAADYDEPTRRWTVTTDGGERVRARFVVMATGCLSDSRVPDLPGRDDFAGLSFHTARWPEPDVELAGKRVGVIGTGSSGVQVIPLLARRAARLTVFQRTPGYTLPAHNRPLPAAEQDAVKARYPEYRAAARRTRGGVPLLPGEISRRPALSVDEATRRAEYERRWAHGGNAITASFRDLLTDAEANATVAAFIREKIADAVTDPATAATLTPRYPYGAKRPCIDTGYYATYNRDNVELVDLRATPLRRITVAGVETDGPGGPHQHPLDVLVYATGFDAFTGALSRIEITGRGGGTLAEKWAPGPLAYLGALPAGFPNLFLITGPGSPSVLSNMVLSIEQHVEWLTALVAHMAEHGWAAVEAGEAAEKAWAEHTRELGRRTVYDGADSWYTGANVPGKTRGLLPYVGGVSAFRAACDAVTAGGYRELEFTR